MNWKRRQLIRQLAPAIFRAVAMLYGAFASCLTHGQLTNKVQNGVTIAHTYSYLPGTDFVSGYTASQASPQSGSNLGGPAAQTSPRSGINLLTRSVAYEPSRNLIAAITNSFTNPSTLQLFNLSTFAYANDSLGRRTAITRGGAAFGDLAGATDTYGYNGRSEVISSRRTLADSPVRGFDYDYAYDPIGNRTSATDYDEQGNPLVSSYTANALNQYTQRTVPGYAALRGEAATNATVTVNERPTFRQGSYFYGGDEADNTTSNLWKELEVYAAINPPGTNTPDIVSATTGTVFVAKTPETFTYDADGNMTSDGRFHYTWNGENRLVCASNAEVVVTYAYDHRGRMVTKTLCSSAPLRLIKTITYLWDDWNIIREVVREGDSAAVTDNVWGLDIDGTLQGAGGVGGLLAVDRHNSSTPNPSTHQLYFPTYDANGNICEYVSESGEIVAHYDYSPFGEPLVTSGLLASTFTHQFSTKPYCAVTGFSEYQMRKYNPAIGRWMSRDPIGEKMGPNLLQFCLNYATTLVDEFGFLTMPPSMPPPKAPPNCTVRYVKDREICFCTEPGTGNAYRRDCGFKCPPGMFPGSASVGHWVFDCKPPSPVIPSPPPPSIPSIPPPPKPLPPITPPVTAPPIRKPLPPRKVPTVPRHSNFPSSKRECCDDMSKKMLIDLLWTAGGSIPKIGPLIRAVDGLANGCPAAGRACQSWAESPLDGEKCLGCCDAIRRAQIGGELLPWFCITMCEPLFDREIRQWQ